MKKKKKKETKSEAKKNYPTHGRISTYKHMDVDQISAHND